jgi:hypothetical protein
MAGWPIVGRFVKIFVAVVRLPEFKAVLLDAYYRQHAFETAQLPALEQAIADLNRRQHVFQTEQLPALLQTFSDLNHRQLSSDNDRDNLVRSVPVALRKITRDLTDIRRQLECVTNSMERRIDETRRLLESVTGSIELRIDETRGQLETVTSSIERRFDEARGQLETITCSMKRGFDEARGQLETVTSSIERRMDEMRSQHESVASSTEQRFAETRNELESITSSMERSIDETRSLLQSVTSSTEHRIDEQRGRLESVTSNVGYLLGRVEFVRRELMFEMRYGAAPSGNGDQLKSKSEILSPKKLAAARNERLRLNLGCGHIPLDGYLNVDRRALPGVDIVAEVDDLPFGPAEVDEILSAHLLEHFPQEQLNRELLPYLIKLFRPGGEFLAVVPDAQAMIQNYANGSYPFGSLREVTFGAQDYDGDFHYNMFTPQSLTEALQAAGLKDIRLIEAGRRNGACYEFEIAGSK